MLGLWLIFVIVLLEFLRTSNTFVNKGHENDRKRLAGGGLGGEREWGKEDGIGEGKRREEEPIS